MCTVFVVAQVKSEIKRGHVGVFRDQVLELSSVAPVVEIHVYGPVHRETRLPADEHTLELGLGRLDLSTCIKCFVFKSLFSVEKFTIMVDVIVGHSSLIHINGLLQVFFLSLSLSHHFLILVLMLLHIVLEERRRRRI